MHSIFNKSQKQEVKQILERWHSREKGQEVATKCDETKLVQCKQASAVSSSVFCLFCFCYCLIWEAKRQTHRDGVREGEREWEMDRCSTYLLIRSTKAWSSLSWGSSKSEARNSTRVSHTSCRNPITWATMAVCQGRRSLETAQEWSQVWNPDIPAWAVGILITRLNTPCSFKYSLF